MKEGCASREDVVCGQGRQPAQGVPEVGPATISDVRGMPTSEGRVRQQGRRGVQSGAAASSGRT